MRLRGSLLLLFVCSVSEAKPVSVKDVLDLSLKKSETIRSVELSIQSLESEIRGRDLALSPVFTSDIAWFRDNRDSLTTSPNRKGVLMDVTLAKPFSTGTELELNVGHELYQSDGFNGERHMADWEVRLSQSLWRDAFGRSTRLRRQGEASELRGRRFEALYSKQKFLVDVEGAYWDLVLAHKEEEVRAENITRSTNLESWLRKRLGKFAAEMTDLLQVQALLSQRKLDLLLVKNRIASARNRLKQFIPEAQPETWELDTKSLELSREPRALLAGGPSVSPEQPVRMDALASLYRSEQKRAESDRVDDSLRPSFEAYVSHGADGIDKQYGSSWSRASGSNQTATQVGVLLSVTLDGDLKGEQRQAARLAADSEKSKASALVRESSLSWAELQRNILSLDAQVRESRSLAELQSRKVKAERARYEQGRTTALQLTTFEVDAAESELRFYRLLADLRKAESTARTYTYDESR